MELELPIMYVAGSSFKESSVKLQCMYITLSKLRNSKLEMIKYNVFYSKQILFTLTFTLIQGHCSHT